VTAPKKHLVHWWGVPPTASSSEPRADRRSGDGRREADKAGNSMRVLAERLDELRDRVGELVIAQARLTQLSGAGTVRDDAAPVLAKVA
ncbi:MAG TPA: hypothetical protein VES39_10260, partial [Rhodospirillales bacterium]|nr:hypothetical protein [Rhodospirillales bacterium]